jgi:hypothetical protein
VTAALAFLLGVLAASAGFLAYHFLAAGKPSAPPAQLVDEIRKILMPIIAGFQPPIDELNAAAPRIAALVAASQPGSASAQDVADTLSAVTQAAQGVVTALPPAA